MGIKQYNRAIQRSYGPTSCEFHENCLSCPLATCIEEMEEEEIEKLRERRREIERNLIINLIQPPSSEESIEPEPVRQKAAQAIARYMGLKSPVSIYPRIRRIRMEPKDRSSQQEMYIRERANLRNKPPSSYRYKLACPHCREAVVYPMRDDETRHYLQALLKKSIGDSIVRRSRHTSCRTDLWLIISVSADLYLTAGLGLSPCDDREMRKPEPQHQQKILKTSPEAPSHHHREMRKPEACYQQTFLKVA